MIVRSGRPVLFCAVLVWCLSLAPSLLHGADNVLFGPREFEVRSWRLHLSLCRFKAEEPGEGLVLISKGDSGRKLRRGFVIFNRTFIPLRGWLRGGDPVLEREVKVRKRNRLLVFLWGQRGASIRVEVRGPTLENGTPAGETKLSASDGATEDYFGSSLAISGDYAIVGAHGDDDGGTLSDAAYIFGRNSPWAERIKLTAGDAAANDLFGTSVSIDDNYAIVGASGAEGYKGSAYIFVRDGTTWVEDAKLTASDGQVDDEFGTSVAIDGEYAIIGAPGSDEYTGSVYLFKRQGDTWIEQARLRANSETPIAFGLSVSISGEYVIVGAFDSADSSGYAYIFRREGSLWTQMAVLTAGDGAGADDFGTSVAISGDYAVVGAPGSSEYTGEAYLFKRNGVAWAEVRRLTAWDGEAGDGFGNSVAIDEGNVIVGASGEDSYSGSAYVYTYSVGPATPFIRVIEPDGVSDTVDTGFRIRWSDSDPDDNATIALYYDNDYKGTDGTLIVGGLSEDPDGGENDNFVWNTSQLPEGTYYVYAVINDGVNDPVVDYSDGPLTIDHTKAKLTAADSAPGDQFGYSVAIDGDYAIVGAPAEGDHRGSAYVFKRGWGWIELAKLTAGDGLSGDEFGYLVAIDGEYAIVGAPSSDSYTGAAYIFARDGTTWVEQARLTAADAEEYDQFGASVAISGEYAVVGAYGDDEYKGSAYVFRRNGSTWTQVAKLVASDRAVYDYFGWSVSTDGAHIAIGAWGKAAWVWDYGYLSDSGAVYVFNRDGSGWTQSSKLTMAYGAWGYDRGYEGYRFGYSVSIDYPHIIAGAPGQDFELVSPGAAYIFTNKGGTWTHKASLIAANPQEYDLFGVSVAIDDDYAMVGSPGAGAYGSGGPNSVYLFARDGEIWTLRDTLTFGETALDDRFGASVALSGNYGLVGAPGTYWNTDYPGAAYIYLVSRVNISADHEKIVYGDSATLSWSFTDATSVIIDNGIGEVSKSGSFTVSPTETTTYTITATGPWGTFTDSVTIVVVPFTVSIDSPLDEEIIYRPDTRVEGTIRNPLNRELGITVNGIIAIVDGERFVANHVLLDQGENTITVTAVDMDGNTETASITVFAETTGDYVRITAEPESGVAPFETTLRVVGSFPFAGEPTLTYTGPGQVEFLENPGENEYNVEIMSEGVYHFTVEARDEQGYVYTDTVAVEVVNLQQLDALLRAKWDGMKAALIAGDIQGGLSYHHAAFRSKYESIYNFLGNNLSALAQQMLDIELIFAEGTRAKYVIHRNHNIDGQIVTIAYYIYFSKDGDGLWKVERY